MHIGPLENGPQISMKIISESVENGVWVPQRSTPKKPSEFTDIDKEYLQLDRNLQLIIMEATDKQCPTWYWAWKL